MLRHFPSDEEEPHEFTLPIYKEPITCDVPPGWTAEFTCTEYRRDWEKTDSAGQWAAGGYGLEEAEPVIQQRELSLVIFESGGKFYLWLRDEEEILEIGCLDIHEISRKISESSESWPDGLDVYEIIH